MTSVNERTLRIRDTYSRVRANPRHPELHEEMVRVAYEAVLRPGMCAIDGGAHSGKHTIPMAQVVGSEGRVLAFEPAPEPRGRLEKAAGSAKIAHIHTSDKALSRAPDRELQFLLFPDRPGISGLARRTDAAGRLPAETMTVRTTTIDQELEGNESEVGFIKLDIEGAELDALDGARATLGRHKPVAHIEASFVSWDAFGYGPIELFALMTPHGYRIIDVIGMEFETPEELDASFRTAGVWDYLLLPNDTRADLLIDEVRRLAWVNFRTETQRRPRLE